MTKEMDSDLCQNDRRKDDTGSDTDSVRRSSGFTLVEVMVVVVVLTIFLGIGLTSGNTIKDQLAFYRDQQVIIAQIYKARALAVATQEGSREVCGYGVRLSGSTITGLEIRKPSSSSFDEQFRGNCELYHESNAVQTNSYSDLNYTLEETSMSGSIQVYFIAPSPLVKFSSGSSACINISSGTASGAIRINRFGQVTTAPSC